MSDTEMSGNDKAVARPCLSHILHEANYSMSKSLTNLQPKLLEPLPPSDKGWLPYNIRYDDAQLVVDCCNIADSQLEDPFFDQTIHRFLRLVPYASQSTFFETLVNINSKRTARKPTGFIFHISRCGSTLIAQILASLQQFVVFSEPAILEKVLRSTYSPVSVSNEQKHGLLENIIQAFLGYKAVEQETFVKFSARAILDYRLITQVFPSVRCIFVYREPVEVLVSLIGNQTDRLPPGLEKAGLLNDDFQTISRMRPAEYWARVVANQCAAAVEMCSCSQPFLVNYSQLPEIVWTDLMNFFGVALSAGDMERMQQVCLRNSKQPHKPFSNDTVNKRGAATSEIHELVDHFVLPYYNRLETIRMAAGRGPT